MGLVGPVSGSEDTLGPSRPVSTAGSRCVVCGLMFSPTLPAEGARPVYKRWRGSRIELLWLLIWALILGGRSFIVSDLWAHLWPAPCIVTQNDSPSVGVDLLRDWLGPAAPGWSIFSLYFSVLSIFFNVGACTALIRVMYCMCTHSVLHVQFSFFVSVFFLLCNLFFPMHGSALLSKSYV